MDGWQGAAGLGNYAPLQPDEATKTVPGRRPQPTNTLIPKLRRSSAEPGGGYRSQGGQARLEGQLWVATAKCRANLPMDPGELPEKSLSGFHTHSTVVLWTPLRLRLGSGLGTGHHPAKD